MDLLFGRGTGTSGTTIDYLSSAWTLQVRSSVRSMTGNPVPPSSGSTTLSTGALIGIIVGCTVGGLILLVIIIIAVRACVKSKQGGGGGGGGAVASPQYAMSPNSTSYAPQPVGYGAAVYDSPAPSAPSLMDMK